MRFHELTAAKHIGIASAPIRLVELPCVGDTDTAGTPEHYPRSLRLVIRFMASVYKHLDLRIAPGDPDAHIDINEAWISFPEPYNTVGDISEDCRKWIIEMVRDASMELGLGFFIGFDDPVYVGRDGTAYCSSSLM